MPARYLLICFLICTPWMLFGQVVNSDSSNKSVPSDNPYEFLLLDTNPKALTPVYKPVLGFGRGIFTFFGDVKDNYNSNPLVGKQAWIGTVSRTLNPYLKLNFSVTYGKLTGNAHNQTDTFNFQSEVLVGGINLSYNFKQLIKKPSRVMPYISLGIESFEFNSKADMKDANGNRYYYWSDGTIRNIDESQGNEMNSVMLQRDYKYETDLRDQNLDGLGKYPQIAFAFPIDLGFELVFTDRLSVRIGTTYHLTFNNNVDNISEKGEGNRKGNKNGDNFLVTYVSLHYDLFSPPKLTVLEQHYTDVQFASIDAEDEDGDGVVDLWDESPGTPPNVKVDQKGRPLDKDNDGIPDFRDKEIESAKDATVDLDGVTYTEDRLITESKSPDAVPTNHICDYYPSLCRETEKIKKFKQSYFEIPEKFKPVDLNNDGYISIEEINIAVDKFFDLNTNYTPEDILELNDFFFDQ
jgi:hypothetical protein